MQLSTVTGTLTAKITAVVRADLDHAMVAAQDNITTGVDDESEGDDLIVLSHEHPCLDLEIKWVDIEWDSAVEHLDD